MANRRGRGHTSTSALGALEIHRLSWLTAVLDWRPLQQRRFLRQTSEASEQLQEPQTFGRCYICFVFLSVLEDLRTSPDDAEDTWTPVSYLLLSSWKQQVPEATRMRSISGMVGMRT